MEATIAGRNKVRILIRRLSLTMTTMRMIVDDCVRKDSLTVFSGFINRIADKLQQLSVKSQGVSFSDTLCAVNEKRRKQEHRLNLSEFKGNCKWIWAT